MKTKSASPSRSSALSQDGVKGFIEKRRSLRSPLMVLEVRWKKYNKVFIARGANLGPGGIFMSTDRALQVGEQFPVEFVLPDNKTKISCTGEVTWTRPLAGEEGGSEGVGVRFLNLKDRTMDDIGQWIKKQEVQSKKRS